MERVFFCLAVFAFSLGTLESSALTVSCRLTKVDAANGRNVALC